jgi:hypothetical protein
MTTPALEAFLARIYVDGAARARFLADPRESARSAGLRESEVEALVAIDRDGLRLFAESLVRRRRAREGGRAAGPSGT